MIVKKKQTNPFIHVRIYQIPELFFLLYLIGCSSNPIREPAQRKLQVLTGDSSFDAIEDHNLKSQLAGIDGSSKLEVAYDDNGRPSIFISNQIILTPTSNKELASFLNKYKAKIVSDDRIPPPRTEWELPFNTEYSKPNTYTIEIDPTTIDLINFKEDAIKIGGIGSHRFSSIDGMKLMALCAQQTINGVQICPNFLLGESASNFIYRTDEQNDPSGYADGFAQKGMAGVGDVTRAWQFLSIHGIKQRIPVAIIDGGFWLDGNGIPLSGNSGIPDLPVRPAQYDIENDDYIADGPSLDTHGWGWP